MQAAQTAQLRLLKEEIVAINAAVATGISLDIDVSETGLVGLCIIGENDDAAAAAVGTVKVRGSFKDNRDVDLSLAASKANPWEYVAIIKYEDTQIVNGTTGIVLAANAIKNCELNQNDLRTIAVEIAAHTTGKFTVLVYGANNQ